MKKVLLLLVSVITVAAFRMGAVPAWPEPQQVTQPADNTTLTVVLHGDEFYHFLTTADGYTLLRREADDALVYATRTADGALTASDVVAHNLNTRTTDERQFTATLSTYMIDDVAAKSAKQAKAKRDAQAKATRPFDFSKFHGLVILVNYSDQKFSRSDANEFYTHMLNDANYTGYTNEDGSTNPYGACTGSVRDYFYDNSNGEFDPRFDVIGPVDLKTADFVIDDGGSKSYEMFIKVLDEIDDQVDFSQYDNDGNGTVDMVYFIVPGSGANSDSDNPNHLWPYKSAFWNVRHDNKRFGAYACSTEFLGSQQLGLLDGIGVICHEFSHVLGLPDLYDTNYATNGQSHDPGSWEIMASGSYGNYSRTPVAYSLYDRYALGFATPQVIKEEGTYSMRSTGTTGDGFILPSPNSKEKFLLENRQRTSKWDATIPGDGMIIARMDSTDASVWTSNTINCNTKHNYYELLRAGGSTSGAVASDAFPGSKNVTMVSNSTAANLKTWNGLDNEFSLKDITNRNGIISFNIFKAESEKKDVEDFEPMPVTTELKATDVQGSLTTWTFNQSYVAEPGAAYSNGKHSVAMIYPSAVYMSTPVRYDAYLVGFTIVNPTGTQAKFTCTYSKTGKTWTALKVSGSENTVPAGETATLFFTAPSTTEAVYYRINMTGGNKSVPCYVDDFTIYYNEVYHDLTGDVNADGAINAGDVSAVYNVMLGTESDTAIIGRADVNADSTVNAGDVSAIYNLILAQ